MKKILIICSLLFLLSGCSQDDSSSVPLENSTQNNEEVQTEYKKRITLLEKTLSQEENYFFQSKEFSIYFPYAIDFIDIHRIELLSDGALVTEISGKENIVVKDKHILILNSNQRFNHFDTVVLKDDQENNIKISIGDYYYEGQIADDTISADKEIFIRNKHYKQTNGTLIYTIDFTNVEGATVEFSVPESIKKIATLIEQKTISKTPDSQTYEFHIEIPEDYLIQQKITNLNLELKADQIYKSSRKTIFQSFIPITLDEFNSKAP
ncbi:membrane lipoprotein lipid attachment site-containing protein [Paenibacillus sp. FSL R5-0519]|uniref:membrane lipoprotein lipid attachment site-containing protein n=1 Tax=Paenibacillus sp. FSL R5-0519 TaxID=2921648 RepID=UPI0030D91814